MKPRSSMSILLGVALLAAGPSAAQPRVAAPNGGGSFPLASFTLAAGNSPCSVELSRFQRVLQSDLETGNVNKSVYEKMERELSGAERACDAGRDGEAIGIIRATKSRHGYRADA